MTFKKDKLYYIKFLDHSVGIKDAMVIEAVGWVVKDASNYVVFTSWKVLSDDTDVVDNNHEPFSIIKSCIKKKKILYF